MIYIYIYICDWYNINDISYVLDLWDICNINGICDTCNICNNNMPYKYYLVYIYVFFYACDGHDFYNICDVYDIRYIHDIMKYVISITWYILFIYRYPCTIHI